MKTKLKLIAGVLSLALLITAVCVALPTQTRTQPASASQTATLVQPTILEKPVTDIPQNTSENITAPAPVKPKDTPAPVTPIVPPAGESICQYPYYEVSSGPNEPTVCALSAGYTDCHNGTAVPNGETCDPNTAPKPYVDPNAGATQ